MWWVVRWCSWWSSDDGGRMVACVGDTRRSNIYRYRGMVGDGMKTIEY